MVSVKSFKNLVIINILVYACVCAFIFLYLFDCLSLFTFFSFSFLFIYRIECKHVMQLWYNTFIRYFISNLEKLVFLSLLVNVIKWIYLMVFVQTKNVFRNNQVKIWIKNKICIFKIQSFSINTLTNNAFTDYLM